MDSVSLLSNEARLLLLTAGGPRNDSGIADLVRSPIDWPLFYHLAAREQAIPVVWKRLQAFDRAAIPAEVAAGLQRFTTVSDFRLLHLEQRLGETLDAFHTAGVDVLLLKGAGLAPTLYGSFAERPMIDLDLLVRAEHADLAMQTAGETRWKRPVDGDGAAFYRDHHHHVPLHDGDGTGFTLELHTELVGGGSRFGLDPAAVWAEARGVPWGGRRVIVPGTLHQLLHLSVHLVWSHALGSAGWRTFRDVALILRRETVDWDALVARCRSARASSCVYWTLRLTQQMVGAEVPGEVLRAIQPPGGEALLQRLERHFAGGLVASEATCPSIRLRRAAWTLAVRPGWSGHGEARPWHRTRAYLKEYGSRERAESHDFVYYRRAARAWGRYLHALIGSRPPSAGRNSR